MFKFEWSVPADGFQWANRTLHPEPGKFRRARAHRFLVPVPSMRRPESYDVFSKPALFRIFAETSPTEDGVLNFANRYGLLGGSYLRRISEPDPLEANTFWPAPGELLSDWIKELALMRHAVLDLWDNVRAGYIARLKPFITWEQTVVGVRVHYCSADLPGWKRSSIVIADEREDVPFAQIRRGDILRPAWLALLRLVTIQLRRFALNGVLTDRSTAKENSAQFSVSASSLLAALWMQFAQAIANNPEFQRCAECGMFFETTTDKRADARFCSSVCRLRAHRKRVKHHARTKTEQRKKK